MSESSVRRDSTVGSVEAGLNRPSGLTARGTGRVRWPFAVVSILILIPCFWHRHIEAGDLASHVYNAWLANEAQAGRAPGLYVATQFHNVAVDLMLAWTGRLLGYGAAEKIVVSLCVLVFFWGAFFFVTVAAKRRPWFLTPVLAMVAYGYTFEMGFFNYYLSIGLCFVAAGLAIRGHRSDWIAAAILAALTFTAHPVGFLLLICIVLYWRTAERMQGWWRLAPLVAALAAVLGVRVYLTQYRVFLYETPRFFFFDGADQVMLFGNRYLALFFILLAFLLFALIYGFVRERRTPALAQMRTPLELWAVLLFAAAVLPEVIYLPQYPAPLALFVSRSTILSAVFLLCAIACLRPHPWQLGGFAACAAFFFAWLYADTGRLNVLEAHAEAMVRALPAGTRIVATMGPERGWRILFLEHIVDRACLGHCYTFDNYEPSAGQFRIRIVPGSRLASDSAADVPLMELGRWPVRAKDLPLKQIYQCSPREFDHVCLRDLRAGELNCAECNSPFYWFLHR